MTEQLLLPIQTRITELTSDGSLAGQTCDVVFSDGTQYQELKISHGDEEPDFPPIRSLEYANGTHDLEPDPTALRYPTTTRLKHEIASIALRHFKQTGKLPRSLSR